MDEQTRARFYTEMAESAQMTFALHVSYINAGFTVEQAFALVRIAVENMTRERFR